MSVHNTPHNVHNTGGQPLNQRTLYTRADLERLRRHIRQTHPLCVFTRGVDAYRQLFDVVEPEVTIAILARQHRNRLRHRWDVEAFHRTSSDPDLSRILMAAVIDADDELRARGDIPDGAIPVDNNTVAALWALCDQAERR